jgi:hypothetical protein
MEKHLHGRVLLVYENGMVRAVVEKHAETMRVEVVLVGHLHLNLGATGWQRDEQIDNEGGGADRRCE